MRERDVHFAVIGATAMAVHGISRSTRDVDLFTLASECLTSRFWEPLARAGVEVNIRRGDPDDPLAGVVRFRAKDEHPVDLVVGKSSWQADVLTAARDAAIEGVRVPVASRVDLVLLKLYAGGPQDAWDILVDQFPMLAALVEQRTGGQRRLPMGGSGEQPVGSPHVVVAVPAKPDDREAAAGDTLPPAADRRTGEASESVRGTVPVVSSGRGRARPGRYELSIQFEERPADPELGRLMGSTVWVNEAHPAYRRAIASRSEAYHLALAVALALAPLAVEPAKEHAFVTSFLVSWGAALDRRRRGR